MSYIPDASIGQAKKTLKIKAKVVKPPGKFPGTPKPKPWPPGKQPGALKTKAKPVSRRACSADQPKQVYSLVYIVLINTVQ